jgi:hypothetical protein
MECNNQDHKKETNTAEPGIVPMQNFDSDLIVDDVLIEAMRFFEYLEERCNAPDQT